MPAPRPPKKPDAPKFGMSAKRLYQEAPAKMAMSVKPMYRDASPADKQAFKSDARKNAIKRPVR